MAKLTDKQYDVVFTEAFAAARSACDKYLKENPNAWFPCGFAWVILEGRDPAVTYLKKNKDRWGRLAGDKGYPKGWHIWDPSNTGTQCMDAKVAGCEAFVAVLAKNGIKCNYESRWD